MSVQTLERQNKKVTTSSENRGLELVVNNEISSIGYFSINNRRYLGNKYKLNNFIQSTIADVCGDFESFADDLRDFEPSFFEEKIFFPIFAIFLNKFMKGQNKIKQCNWLQAISFLIGAKIGKAKKTQQDSNGGVK